MKFEGFKLSRFMMYNGWLVGLLMIFLFILLRPILDNRITFNLLFNTFFLKDTKLTLLLFFLCFLIQIAGYDCSRTKIKLLELLEDKAVFNLLNGKVFEFKYSDLASLERTKDAFKIFEFTFKDGRKQKISDSVKNSELALKLIQQKITESNQPINLNL